jgi:hypothetical protein
MKEAKYLVLPMDAGVEDCKIESHCDRFRFRKGGRCKRGLRGSLKNRLLQLFPWICVAVLLVTSISFFTEDKHRPGYTKLR